MLPSIPLQLFIDLGQLLWYLESTPQQATANDVRDALSNFMNKLTQCGLHEPLAAVSAIDGSQLNDNIVTRRISDLSRLQLHHGIPPVRAAIHHISQQWQMIRLNTFGVSPKLRQLPTLITLNDTQNHLLDETIRCIECEAYRSAIVMGWNLAFDFIRQWVFDNRLADFNKALVNHSTVKKTGKPKYAALTSYNGFWEADDSPGEKIILECCLDGGIIGGNVYDDLRKHLRERNKTAHANSAMPTSNKANAYIEELIDIITAPPFRP